MPIFNTFTSAAARAFKGVISSLVDPFFSSVGLLLHGDLFGTTNQNNTFLDSSSNNLTITNSTVIQGSYSPYSPSGNYDPTVYGGSGYFNGSSQLSIASNSQTALLSGDFAIEAWARFGTGGGASQVIYYNNTGGTGGWSAGNIYLGKHTQASGNMTFWAFNFSASNPMLTDPTAIPDNQWIHYAVTRSGNTFRMFRNGAQVASNTFSGAATNATNPCFIGTSGATNSQPILGYISNLRIVKGSPVYTNSFPPPTSPVGNIAGTALLLNFANAAAYDQSAKVNLNSWVNAAVSSVQKKFGTGSLYFDGSSHFQYTEQTSTFIGTGDFTVEFWAYKTVNGIARPFSSTSSIFIQDGNFSQLRLFWSNPETLITSFGSQIPLNTWTHIAVTRQGNTFRMYVNGTLSATATSSLTTASSAEGYIGGLGAAFGEFFNGYIDELRVTKGVARYTTATFPVPAAPYPNS